MHLCFLSLVEGGNDLFLMVSYARRLPRWNRFCVHFPNARGVSRCRICIEANWQGSTRSFSTIAPRQRRLSTVSARSLSRPIPMALDSETAFPGYIEVSEPLFWLSWVTRVKDGKYASFFFHFLTLMWKLEGNLFRVLMMLSYSILSRTNAWKRTFAISQISALADEAHWKLPTPHP